MVYRAMGAKIGRRVRFVSERAPLLTIYPRVGLLARFWDILSRSGITRDW